MRIHTVFITHDRLHLTKIALETYLETVNVPYSYVVVDNASTDGTREWLQDSAHPYLLLDENRYPGFACNRGWEMAPPDADFLHRADNDFRFLSNWCQEVQRRFRQPSIGQVGLRTDREEVWARLNVGGNNVIRRSLWDRGLRYDERPWTEYDASMSEDAYFSPQVQRMGMGWTRVKRPCIQPLEDYDFSEGSYYRRSLGARQIPIPGDEPSDS